MIRRLVDRTAKDSDWCGLSTDVKPQNAGINNLFLELDTGDFYYCKSVSQTSEETPIDLKITKRTWVDQDITLSDWHDSVNGDIFYPSPYVVLEGNAENYAYITYPFIDLTVDDGTIQYELDDDVMLYNNGKFEAICNVFSLYLIGSRILALFLQGI